MVSEAGLQLRSKSLSKERLRLWLRLLKASRLIEGQLRRRLKDEFSSTLPRFDVMSALARASDGMTMTEISRRLRVSNGNVTGIVDTLVNEGLVQRMTSSEDRRSQTVSLTTTGRVEFETYAGAHEAWIDDMMAGLDEDDVGGMVKRLDHLLEKLTDKV